MGIGAGLGAAIGGVAAGAGGVASSLIGGGKSSGGSQQSAYLQAMQMNQNIVNTQPFISAGGAAAGNLQNLLQSGQLGTPMDLSGMPTAADAPKFNLGPAPQYTGGPPPQYTGGAPPQYTGGPPPQYTGGAPPTFSWDPTMAGLAQTPGYQFTLQQGLLGTQNAAAARGLGVSGAALKGADTFATGLASQTYNQQLNNAESIYGNQLAGFGAGLNQYNAQLAGFGAGLNQYNAQLAGFGQGINQYNAQLAGFGQGINAYNAQVGGYQAGVNAFGQQIAGFQAQTGAFQNQFQDYWANQTNRFNQLANLAQLGGNVSVGQGSNATTAAGNIGNAVQAQGQYQGAGIANAGNALSNAFNSPAVLNALTGSGTGANNQSVTGGGLFNSFSGVGPYLGGYGQYYQGGSTISPPSTSPGYGNQLFQSGGIF
jgi:hypothetical protein